MTGNPEISINSPASARQSYQDSRMAEDKSIGSQRKPVDLVEGLRPDEEVQAVEYLLAQGGFNPPQT